MPLPNIVRGFFGGMLRTRSLSLTLNSIQKMGFKTYRAGFIAPHGKPMTLDEMRKTVQLDFARAQKAGLLTPRQDCLQVVTGAEFSRNGYTNSEGQDQFDASQPISKDLYNAMIEEALRLAKGFPDGTVYCPGSVAIDTGQVDGGKKIGENRGFAIQCGSSNYDPLEFTKKVPSGIDGWDFSSFTLPQGDGAKVIRIQDLLWGGRPVNLCYGICLDLLTSVRYFPAPFDLLALPSAGAPVPPDKAEDFRNADFLVNDSMYNSFKADYVMDQMGVWVPKDSPYYPTLGNLLKRFEGMPFFYSTLCTMLSGALAIDYKKFGTNVKAYSKFKVIDYHAPGEVVALAERPVPGAVSDDALPQVASQVEKGATIVDGFKGYADKVVEMQKDLPWDYIRGEIEKAVKDEVQAALEKIDDPTGQKVADLAKLVNSADFQQKIQDRVADLVSEAMSGVDGFAELYTDIASTMGDDAADGLVSEVVGTPLWEKMAGQGQSTAYLSSLVTSSVADYVQHEARQKGDTAQRLAAAQQTADQTKGEVDGKNAALKDVEDQLKQKPNDPDLQKQKAQLEADLAALEKALQDATDSLDEARKDRDADVDATDSKDDADRDAEKARKDVFPGRE